MKKSYHSMVAPMALASATLLGATSWPMFSPPSFSMCFPFPLIRYSLVESRVDCPISPDILEGRHLPLGLRRLLRPGSVIRVNMPRQEVPVQIKVATPCGRGRPGTVHPSVEHHRVAGIQRLLAHSLYLVEVVNSNSVGAHEPGHLQEDRGLVVRC